MKSLSMTEGKVTPLLIRFAIPLMLGDFFQQLYIAADAAMVGRFAGDTALAAVSSSTFLIRMLIGLFVGISAGASVVISHNVGAGEYEIVKRVIHTMAALTIVGGIAISVFSILFSPTLLQLVSTPAEIMEEAVIYLQTYFAGALFQLIYNVGAGILRSFGDSRRPFLFLVISSVSNIVLDYLLLAVFPMGVFGAAAATVLSQVISAVCVLFVMVRATQPYRLVIKEIHIHREYLGEILKMGLPAGLQSVIVSLSNVLVQHHINVMGTAVVAGFGLFNKIDGVIMLPGNALAMAAMTFVGQNFGAGKYKRIREGIKSMCVLMLLGWLAGCMICIFFRAPIFGLFTDQIEILLYAEETMKYLIPAYFAMNIGYGFTCVIRALDKSREASVMFVACMCFMRQAWILVMERAGAGLEGILLSYPFSWLLTLAVTGCYILYLESREKGEKKWTEVKGRTAL